MFEKYGVPSLCIATQPLLTLYASKRSSGVVLECGDGVCYVVPVHNGRVLPHAVQRWNLAGADLTDYLRKIVTERVSSFVGNRDIELFRHMKHTLCYVATDYELEMRKAADSDVERKYEVADGTEITIESERFRCPELLFNPACLDPTAVGVHDTIIGSILKCDVDIRSVMYSNIVLGGGCTLFPGMAERLHKEITLQSPPGTNTGINVAALQNRQHSAWTGGSMIASQAWKFKEASISKEEYKEYGPSIVQEKCLFTALAV